MLSKNTIATPNYNNFDMEINSNQLYFIYKLVAHILFAIYLIFSFLFRNTSI